MSLSTELASLNKLTANLIPADKFSTMLQQIMIRLPTVAKLLAPIRPENMHIFCESMQLTAIATNESVRLLAQIPVKTEQSTYTVYGAIPIPTFQPDIRNFMQIGRMREWFAIRADFRNYLRLDFDCVTYCRNGYITFCDFREAVLDRSFESCIGDCSSGSRT
jgi:hypothetical protein